MHQWEPDGPAVPARPVAWPVDVDGRGIAWCGFVAGAVLSVAANVAHAQPTAGARIAGAAWPLLLLLAFEVLTRVRWRPSRWRAAARYFGATAVAVVAAVMSYRHMAALLGRYGEDGFGAHLGPLAVDGLMVVCGAALLSTARAADKAEAEAVEPVIEGRLPREDQPDEVPAESPVGQVASPTPARPATKPTAKPGRTRSRSSSGPDITDLHDPIAQVLAVDGPGLNRDRLAAALRAKGCTVGGARKQAAKDYYDQLVKDRRLEVVA